MCNEEAMTTGTGREDNRVNKLKLFNVRKSSISYKFLLTLSITQVACERSFSTLKCVKNRLRSSLSQDNLEAFMLMRTEKEILMSISNDTVIDKVAETSALLRRLGCICCWCYSQCNCILYCELNCKH